MAYDYMDATSTGIKKYILECVDPQSISEKELFWELADRCSANKGILIFDYNGYVYTNKSYAKSCLIDNSSLLGDAFEFFDSDELYQYNENDDYPMLDAAIRDYLFMEAFDKAVDLIDKKHPNFFKEADDEE